MKKNLVMSAATGYGWYDLETFVNSCKKYCQNSDIVLFVDDISDFTRDKLLRGGVNIVDIPAEHRNEIINNVRWKIYADFLDKFGDFEQILVADVRDVVFQGDVFAKFGKYQNYLCYSEELLTIGEDKIFNYRWIADCFGNDEADKLSDKKVICCGVIIGTSHEINIFCHELWKNLQYHMTDIYDQGVTMYIVYENLLPIKNIIKSDVKSGEIVSNGAIKDDEIRNNYILRGDGGVPAVVHQYDRNKTLVALVDSIYREKTFQFEEKFTDSRSILDISAYLLHIGGFNEAIRLFLSLDGANLGENLNRLIKIWEFILNQPLTPEIGYFELAIQRAIASVRNFPTKYLNHICIFLTYAIKNRRAVYPPFVEFVANSLALLAEQNLNAGNSDACFYCINAINELNLPPNKDFYLLQARAYRIFGRKEEALTAYKKLLDLE